MYGPMQKFVHLPAGSLSFVQWEAHFSLIQRERGEGNRGVRKLKNRTKIMSIATRGQPIRLALMPSGLLPDFHVPTRAMFLVKRKQTKPLHTSYAITVTSGCNGHDIGPKVYSLTCATCYLRTSDFFWTPKQGYKPFAENW